MKAKLRNQVSVFDAILVRIIAFIVKCIKISYFCRKLPILLFSVSFGKGYQAACKSLVKSMVPITNWVPTVVLLFFVIGCSNEESNEYGFYSAI